MTETGTASGSPAKAGQRASALDVFITFLTIGAISFGGGVVAYLRGSLVRQKKWLDDTEFLELMSISNTLPGLNATNMAILAGDRLAGPIGAVGGLVGMCLPAFIFMTLAGVVYGSHVDRPLVDAALRGIAAAATGMIASTWYSIGKKSLKGFNDALFVVLAILGVNYFKLGVPLTLVVVGGFAVFAFRPHVHKESHEKESEQWIRSLQ
jgi:chromate transporter